MQIQSDKNLGHEEEDNSWHQLIKVEKGDEKGLLLCEHSKRTKNHKKFSLQSQVSCI